MTDELRHLIRDCYIRIKVSRRRYSGELELSQREQMNQNYGSAKSHRLTAQMYAKEIRHLKVLWKILQREVVRQQGVKNDDNSRMG